MRQNIEDVSCKEGMIIVNIAICDDEESFVQELQAYVLQFAKRGGFAIDIQTYTSGKCLISDIDNGYVYDLLFLDIELGDVTGVEIGKKIRSNICNECIQIVFVSAKEDYAMQLFELRPMNFLVKPVSYDKVTCIMNEYGRLFQFHPLYFRYKIGKQERTVNQRIILYFQSIGKKIQMVTQTGAVEFYGKLSDIIPVLNSGIFCVVHKSYVINMKYVIEYRQNYVIMVNQDEIPVSRAMRGSLQDKYIEGIIYNEDYGDHM